MKTGTKYKGKQVKQTYTIPPVFWILTVAAVSVIFFMHAYSDLLITAKQAKIFWNCLFAGKPMSFYKEARLYLDYPYNDGHLFHAAYPFPIYFLFAVWELPVWIIERITQNDLFNTMANKIWLKMFLMLFVFLCTQQMYKIVKHIDSIKDKAHLSAYLFLTSSFLLTSTGIASQYDIVTLLFVLLGFDAWLCRKNKEFIIWFAAAVSLKYFALIYFVPLLLIREKKITKIILNGILTLVPTFIIFAIFPKPDTQISNVTTLVYRFTTGTVNLGKASVIPFVIVMLALCLWAYFFSSKDSIQEAVFAMLTAAGAFCFLADIYPYWSVLGSSMFILAVLLSNGNINKALWCEMIMCAGLIAINFMDFRWVFSSKTLAAMGLFTALFKVPVATLAEAEFGPVYLFKALGSNGSSVSYYMLYSFVICAWGFLSLLCKPKQKKIELLEPLSYWSIALRSVVNIGIAGLPLLMNFAYFVILHKA